MIKVLPAINETTVRELRRKMKIAEKLSHLIDVDISDGKFSKRKTVPLSALVGLTHHPLSIHYMGENPEKIINHLPVNTYRFTFHYEAARDVQSLLTQLNRRHIIPSIGLNPETTVKMVREFAKKRVQFHILTVHPGGSGQKLLPSCLGKVKKLKKLNSKLYVGIDGGVNMSTARMIRMYPVDYVSATSAIFQSKNPALAMKNLEKALN
jgi:ribulose-phosphate 3-epimerase